MNEFEVLQVLKNLVEGRVSPKEWLQWWDAHESDAKRVFSAGQFLRLKPRIRSHGDAVVVERCRKEACAILQTRKISYVENLREEFISGRELSTARTAFAGRVITIVEERHRASAPFDVIDVWFQEFRDSGELDTDKWILARTDSLFRYVSQPPLWINEPEWPWNGGSTLIFLGQISMPDNAVSAAAMVSGLELYIFSERIPDGQSFKVGYTIVQQQLL